MTPDALIPIDLASLAGGFTAFAVATGVVAFRYFAIALPAYGYFWLRAAAKGDNRRLHDQKLPEGQIRMEIYWSMVATVIFAAAAVVLGLLWQTGASQIYSELDGGFGLVGLAYLPVSFGLYAIAHELYYYLSHRWMHRPKVYRIVHAVHHASRKTSPFASFSFHPYEAIIQAAFIPLMVVIVPIHPAVLLAYLTFMTVTAVSNHLGVELIGSEKLKKHFISGSHHDLHHKFMNVHFGLYFTASDKFWGTELPVSSQKAKTVTQRQGETVA